MHQSPEIPEIVVVATTLSIAYVDPRRDLAGTMPYPSNFSDGPKAEEQVNSACSSLLSQLEADYTSPKIVHWREQQPVNIDDYNQRLFSYLDHAIFAHKQTVTFPGICLSGRIVRDMFQAPRLSIAQYFTSLGGHRVRKTTLDIDKLRRFVGALLVVKHFSALRFDCYTVSYAFSAYLRSIGVRHTVNLGINPDPMMMHAWVSIGDDIVLDMPSTPDEFLSIVQAHV